MKDKQQTSVNPLKGVPLDAKRDLAFQMTVALRDTLSIAKKKGTKPTYENSLAFFYDFNPELYEEVIKALPQRNLSDEAKTFQALAEVNGTTPIEELDVNINIYREALKKKESLDNQKTELFHRKIANLESLRKSLKPRVINENRILQRDFSKVDRTDFGASFLDSNDFYIDYKLTEKKYLRLRLLHPDKPEHITGADLIYEQHDTKNNRIRFMFLQYKLWENGVLYFSKAKNLENQLRRLKGCLCDTGYCVGPTVEEGDVNFRFPHCSAFLRPTDKLQEQNEKLISSGIHIPICALPRLKTIEGDKLEKKYLKYSALNQEIFEYLFNRDFIGSRWLDQDEVEKFYRENKILEADESVILYAREILDNQQQDVQHYE